MRCPTCGFDNPAGMRLCGNCGTALEGVAGAGEERKLVTVLFADVVGSTALAAAVDPERLRGQMARFFAVAREEVERYGGTVEKFIGDAVMAVFGLPVIHEDDAERAARAVSAIRARIEPEVAAGRLPPIRAGLATGEVVANPRAVEKGEFLVTGEVVNLAARLQQHAEPGQILVSARTMRALQHAAALRAAPPLTVKGPADPLPAWELRDLAPPREREVRATPFVGREEELDLLVGHLRRTRREGRGHVVTILGPAGVGKTRLVQEFRQRAGDVHSLRGRALPYGTGVPLWALGETIREECGILFGDPLDTARRKVTAAAGRLDVVDGVPALLSVLGLGPAGRDLTRQELFAGMRVFFRALAERGPLLLILEDMHSADDVTLDYLEHSADWIREIPLLLLVLSRAELLERRPTWLGGKRSASTLSLDPLGGQESLALARGILGGRDAPEELLDRVLKRAEGNPLFMEEMLRAWIEGGVLTPAGDRWTLAVPLAEVPVPDTVHAVIAARVDTLPAAEKQVLQVAAVQGKDFWLGGVRHIVTDDHVDQALAGLEQREFVIRKPRSVLAAEEEFTFRHILIRDVAYGLIPKAQRWPMHARLAEWSARTVGDRQAE
ncbi:MAG: adenylate/guanylate cyclase domain-containing protein [Armatimonadota bacterium]|nr:adenylate/guanylate cyclase domain-containing protein [Armatimonadota bacterium]MDR7450123.1 adenylate/guanylate cyclase domain-containing protein [Armatimonadota bacterium]MDR7460301.1 adenylate/guanylate cyclase domain-containing protein [Armatimonadota bacterium]MDR7480755.1 adenylate/guanylate cyclase domain-containing protein [Armatimonadota bacterium]MDR7488951.1 adenylate/guanylate cyclase domain-containing protein [Armatimonadota bacterium]